MNKQLLLGIAIGAAVVALIANVAITPLIYGLLFLACPLMMVFMMGGHGHGAARHDDHSGNEEFEKSK
jgi:putative copper export protein